MAERNIVSDIEYLQNQADYLSSYIKKINVEFNILNAFKTKWSGPQMDEPIYVEIGRFLKCYHQFKDQLNGNTNYLNVLDNMEGSLIDVDFVKPTTRLEDIKSWSALKKTLQLVFPPLRLSANNQKIKQLKQQVDQYNSIAINSKKIVLALKQNFLNETIVD